MFPWHRDDTYRNSRNSRIAVKREISVWLCMFKCLAPVLRCLFTLNLSRSIYGHSLERTSVQDMRLCLNKQNTIPYTNLHTSIQHAWQASKSQPLPWWTFSFFWRIKKRLLRYPFSGRFKSSGLTNAVVIMTILFQFPYHLVRLLKIIFKHT